MRRRALLCTTLIFTTLACGGDKLHIVITVPASYRAQLAATRLSVLQASALLPFDCDDLAFGRPAAAAAPGNIVQQVTIGGGSGTELLDIDRDTDKLLWMQGLQADGTVLVQACAPVSAVKHTITVTLAGEPTTVLVPPPPAELYGGTLFGPLPSSVPIQVTDVAGAPLASAPVEWQLVGPSAIAPALAAATDDDGDVVVPVPPPDRPGPYVLEIRGRWQAVPLPVIHGLAEPRALFDQQLPVWSLDYAVGRLGPKGEPGVAVLAMPDSGPPEQIELWYFNGTTLVPSATVPIPSSSPTDQPAAIVVVSRADGDHVVTVARSPSCAPSACWVDVAGDGSLSQRPLSGVTSTMRDTVHIGGCDASSGDEVLIGFADGTTGAYDAEGTPMARGFAQFTVGNLALLAGGCTVDTAGTPHRAVASVLPPGTVALAVEQTAIAAQFMATPLFVPVAGFLPAVGNDPPLLLAGDYQISGIAISELELRIDATALETVTVESQPTIPTPAAIVGGDLDADAQGDIAALMQLQNDGSPDQQPFRRLFVFGVRYRGERLFAASREEVWRNPELLTTDFDGDGCTDILIGERLPMSGTAHSTVRIQSFCE